MSLLERSTLLQLEPGHKNQQNQQQKNRNSKPRAFPIEQLLSRSQVLDG
jgi:hypothetical protein